MAEKKTKKASDKLTTEQKLKFLYDLQCVDTEISKIQTVRGELPLEIDDLKDELAGLTTRIERLKEDVENLEVAISDNKNKISESEALIKKYEEQQNNVRNNREFDSLTKEIEFQGLEIQLCEKKIKQTKAAIEQKQESITKAEQDFEEKNDYLQQKESELNDIISETEAEEKKLENKAKRIEKNIEERYLHAYKRIRDGARNNLAVATIQRDACGGCFNKIPPQRYADIRSHKKIIVCEYCGRILIDESISEIK